MPTLTAPEHDHFHQLLHAERVTLLASASSLHRDQVTLAESQTDGESRVRGEGEGDTATVERAVVARLSAQNQNALAEIDAALARLADGSYGICTGCRQPIPTARLEVRPRTTTCVPCAR